MVFHMIPVFFCYNHVLQGLILGTGACNARAVFWYGGLYCKDWFWGTGACTARTDFVVLGPVLQGLILGYWGLHCND